MTPEAWFTLLVVAATVVALVREWFPPHVVLLGAMSVFLVTGVTTPGRAFSGFTNPAPLTVAALWVLARAVNRTGALRPLVAGVLSGRDGERSRLLRIVVPTAGASAFLNNTPVTAMLISPIVRWAEERGRDPGLYLMPLSFAAILGGMLTLVGTSTNLVVSGLVEETGRRPLGMFEMTPVAAPAVCVGLLIVVALTPRLLPRRDPVTFPAGVGASGRKGDPSVAGSDPDPSGEDGSDRTGTSPEPAEAGEPMEAPGGLGEGTNRLRSWLALGSVAGVVGSAALGWIPIVYGAVGAVALLVVTGALSPWEAVRSVDFGVILLIASAFGVGAAIEDSGLAGVLAGGLVGAAQDLGAVAVLAGVALCTLVLTELITNNAAAVLMFPIALAAASVVEVEPRAFIWAVALVASASFLTPIGYQTNAMVYGAGRYRFGDYARLGTPVALGVAISVVLGIATHWELWGS